ncbi:MAG TPA: homocysteine S-methyltransferase family protein [Gaiellaceae bacterium]|jgi:S-methylmethionine-dependent homocysteine/selenocysteine methylase
MSTLFGDSVQLTDGGMETTLIYHDGIELPDFAAFTVLASDEGRAALAAYYDAYVSVAEARGLPIVLDTPTWRASSDWGARLGYSTGRLADVNRDAVAFLRDACAGRTARIVVSGAVGPRGDGYVAGATMSTVDARDYHAPQIEALAAAGVDLVSAITMTYAEEAAGIAFAAQRARVPVAVSFTVETDGTLPSGQRLADAVAQVDDETGAAPIHYLVNCAHPTHFGHVLADAPVGRVRGVRVNASSKSHAELDASDELDVGDPLELAAEVAGLRGRGADLTVFGGCCGTDHRHIDALAAALGH